MKCLGNPFHALQILKDIASKTSCQEKCHANQRTADADLDCSLSQLENLRFIDSMNGLLSEKLMALPELSLRVLKVCACLGDEIDESAAAIVLEIEDSEVRRVIQIAADDGHLIFDKSRVSFRFSHDQIRQEVMAQIEDIEYMMFQIGFCLWMKSSPIFLCTKMFVVANLLNQGTNLLKDQAHRYRAASLNWEAGVKAASLANFADSSKYLTAGIHFLKGGDYWNEQYDLTLRLFNASADTEVCTQNFVKVMQLVQEVLDNARTLHDKIQACVARINCLCQSGNTHQAINIAIDVLQQLGERMPQTATKGAIIREILMTKLLLTSRFNSNLMSLRPMENKDKLHAMHLLAVIVPYAFQARSYYNPLMATRMVRLCLKHGFHKSGAMGLVTYGWVICSHDRNEGYRLGSQAMALVERLRAREMIPRVHTSFYGFVHHWKSPVRGSLEPLKRAAATAMDVGDVECAMWARYLTCILMLVCAVPLAQVAAEFEETAKQLRLYKQDNLLALLRPTNAYICKVMDQTPASVFLSADTDSETQGSKESAHPRSTLLEYVRLAAEANVAYRFGEFQRAGQLSDEQRSMKYEFGATFSSCSSRQLEALISVACARLGAEKQKNLKIAQQALKQMKAWSADCPENFLSLQQMLEAEIRSLKPHKGVNDSIVHLYDQSVADGVKNGFIQLSALANELAGDYANRQGDNPFARKRWEEAYRYYIAWGATAKASQLVNKTGIILT